MTCQDMIYSNDYMDLIVNLHEGNRSILRFYPDSCINEIEDRIEIFHLQTENSYLTNLENVPYSSVPKLFGLMDSSNMEVTGVKQIQSPSYLGLDGSGVIVGIIDTGIMYDNALFRDVNGNSRIGIIWDQTIRKEDPENVNMSEEERSVMVATLKTEQQTQTVTLPLYGTAYTNAQINEALQSDNPYELVPTRDEDGHGTFLAGIAAGGVNRENDFTGIATGAEIAVVKLKETKPYLREFFQIKQDVPAYSETDIIYAVDFLLKYSRAKKKPLSLLIGLGSSNGGHEGLTYLEQYLSVILQNVEIMVSVPAGNEGTERLHYYGGLPKNVAYDEVEINVDAGQSGLTFELWGNAPNTFALGIVSPRGDRIERIAPRFGREELISLPLSRTTVYVAYQLAEAYSGNQLIFVRLINPPPGIWRFLVYADEGQQRTFNIWMPLRQFLQDNTYFLKGNPDDTITVPGNEKSSMTMTAYNHLNGSIFAQASRGYNARDQVKPDLTAPGVNITGPGLRNNFVTRSGTSVAAAHSAGMFAQFFQWDLENDRNNMFFSGQIKSFFLRGAVRDPDMQYPTPIWGYGIMNIERAFEGFRVIDA
ncbi:MAG: S8 family peptidase [Clostridium sp.]|nr:S8 family peptidase [Clostridium sp.]